MFKLLPSLLLVTKLFINGNALAKDRDPTMPLAGFTIANVEVETITLQSILVSGSRKIAVINGQSAMENDTVDGALIKSITAHEVTVIHKGQKKILNLMLPSIKSQGGVSQGY